jgi:hypothetical protein
VAPPAQRATGRSTGALVVGIFEGGADGGVSIFAGSVHVVVVAVPGTSTSCPLSFLSHTADLQTWQFGFVGCVLQVCLPHA